MIATSHTQSVSPADAKAWLDANQAVLIDVREPAEHQAKRIECAISIPIDKISSLTLPPSCAHKKIIVHCKGGGRGSKACEKLITENPQLDVYNLSGGITAWEQLGFACRTSNPHFLPLDRQVQLTIGLAILASTLLTLTVNIQWVWLALFLGAGLTTAGLTGWCGLAKLIAKMPWNQTKKMPNMCQLR